MLTVIQRLERLVSDLPKDGPNLDDLRTIEELVSDLSSLELRRAQATFADLGEIGRSLEAACERAHADRFPVFLCDLPSPRGEKPTPEEISANPDLAIIARLVSGHSAVNCVISSRAIRSGISAPVMGSPLDPGPTVEGYRYCLAAYPKESGSMGGAVR